MWRADSGDDLRHADRPQSRHLRRCLNALFLRFFQQSLPGIAAQLAQVIELPVEKLGARLQPLIFELSQPRWRLRV